MLHRRIFFHLLIIKVGERPERAPPSCKQKLRCNLGRVANKLCAYCFETFVYWLYIYSFVDDISCVGTCIIDDMVFRNDPAYVPCGFIKLCTSCYYCYIFPWLYMYINCTYGFISSFFHISISLFLHIIISIFPMFIIVISIFPYFQI